MREGRHNNVKADTNLYGGTNQVEETEIEIEEMHKALRKMVWLNTSLLWMILIVSTITMISVWIDNTLIQMLVFLPIGISGCIFWYKTDKKVKCKI